MMPFDLMVMSFVCPYGNHTPRCAYITDQEVASWGFDVWDGWFA